MNRTITNSLTEAELALVRETDRDRLAGLDEDALADLHDRIRRARTKHVTIYRRTGAATVGAKGGRGVAKERNARNAAKAEVFEDALARVSRALAAAARSSATMLRAERVAAARAERSAGPRRGPGSGPTARRRAARGPCPGTRRPGGSGTPRRWQPEHAGRPAGTASGRPSADAVELVDRAEQVALVEEVDRDEVRQHPALLRTPDQVRPEHAERVDLAGVGDQ